MQIRFIPLPLYGGLRTAELITELQRPPCLPKPLTIRFGGIHAMVAPNKIRPATPHRLQGEKCSRFTVYTFLKTNLILVKQGNSKNDVPFPKKDMYGSIYLYIISIESWVITYNFVHMERSLMFPWRVLSFPCHHQRKEVIIVTVLWVWEIYTFQLAL